MEIRFQPGQITTNSVFFQNTIPKCSKTHGKVNRNIQKKEKTNKNNNNPNNNNNHNNND